MKYEQPCFDLAVPRAYNRATRENKKLTNSACCPTSYPHSCPVGMPCHFWQTRHSNFELSPLPFLPLSFSFFDFYHPLTFGWILPALVSTFPEDVEAGRSSLLRTD